MTSHTAKIASVVLIAMTFILVGTPLAYAETAIPQENVSDGGLGDNAIFLEAQSLLVERYGGLNDPASDVTLPDPSEQMTALSVDPEPATGLPVPRGPLSRSADTVTDRSNLSLAAKQNVFSSEHSRMSLEAFSALNVPDRARFVATPANVTPDLTMRFVSPNAATVDLIKNDIPGATVGLSNQRVGYGVDFSYVEYPKFLEAISRHGVSNGFLDGFVTGTQAPAPNDIRWAEWWGKDITNLVGGWGRTLGNQGVVIAVLDSGVAVTDELGGAEKVLGGVNATRSFAQARTPAGFYGGSDFHGTVVAAQAAGTMNNSFGVAGTCPNCSILPVRVFAPFVEYSSFTDIAVGIHASVDGGASVINMSLGGERPSDPAAFRAVDDAIARARSANIVVVVAAGNDGSTALQYPATAPGVIGVAAHDEVGKLYDWSSRGENAKVAAPGCNWSVNSLQGEAFWCGTSSAAPFVAGVVGLMKSINPTITPDQVLAFLATGATPVSDVQYGRVNVASAVAAVPDSTVLPTGAPAPPKSCGFTDAAQIPGWARQATCWGKQQGIIATDALAPLTNVTRSQLAMFLWRAAGRPYVGTYGFDDYSAIPESVLSAASWALINGIMTGDPFNSAEPLTRVRMITVLWRAAGRPAASTSCGFTDVATVTNDIMRRSLCWAKDVGVLTGTRADPNTLTSRAMAVTFMHREYLSRVNTQMILPRAPRAAITISGNLTCALDWQPGRPGRQPVTAYVVERQTGAGTWTQVYSGLKENLTESDLQNGTTYNYRVKAVSPEGVSTVSLSNPCTPAPRNTANDMVLRFDTTKGTPDGEVILPLASPAQGSMTTALVDWGDGTVSALPYGKFARKHYVTNGLYTVRISGTVTDFGSVQGSYNATSLVAVDSFGNTGLTGMTGAFWGATNLVSVPTTLPPTVYSLFAAFAEATSFNQSLNGWDVSNVLHVGYMFYKATSYNQRMDWDMSGMRNMEAFLAMAMSYNQPVNQWDVSNVIISRYLFYGATSFNQPLDNWNVASVVDAEGMFEWAMVFNQPLNGWQTSSIFWAAYMFANAMAFNQPLNQWDMSNTFFMTSMFDGAKRFNQNVSGWSVEGVGQYENFARNSALTPSNIPPKFRQVDLAP